MNEVNKEFVEKQGRIRRTGHSRGSPKTYLAYQKDTGMWVRAYILIYWQR